MSTIPNPKFQYLPKGFKITDWESLKPFYEALKHRPIETVQDLQQWIADHNELHAVVSEDFAWRYIRISQNSQDKKALEAYQYAVEEISPKISPYAHELNKKLVHHPLVGKLPKQEYFIALRGLKTAVEIYRRENIVLATEEAMTAKKHGEL